MKVFLMLIIFFILNISFKPCQISEEDVCGQWGNVKIGTSWKYETYTKKNKLFKKMITKVIAFPEEDSNYCTLETSVIYKNGKEAHFSFETIRFENEMYINRSKSSFGSAMIRFLCEPTPEDKQTDYLGYVIYDPQTLNKPQPVEYTDIHYGQFEEITCPAGTFTCIPVYCTLLRDGIVWTYWTAWINRDIGTIKSTSENSKHEVQWTVLLAEFKP